MTERDGITIGPLVTTSGPIGDLAVIDVLRSLTDGVVALHRLREHGLDDGLCWVLPHGQAVTMTSFHGLPVHHADVPHPVLGHRVGDWRPLDLTALDSTVPGPDRKD